MIEVMMEVIIEMLQPDIEMLQPDVATHNRPGHAAVEEATPIFKSFLQSISMFFSTYSSELTFENAYDL